MSVVQSVNKLAAKDDVLIRLIRILVGLILRIDIEVLACHLPGSKNEAADALSRSFFSF